MLGHLQVRQSSLPSPPWVLPFFLIPSQVPFGLNSCPIDSIAKPEELLTLVVYWVDRAGDLIDRWHNYSKIIQKDTRQVLTRSQSSLLHHTLLPLRVGKNRPCSGTASTSARTMPTEEACAGLSRPMIALALPSCCCYRYGQLCSKDEVTAIQSGQVVGTGFGPRFYWLPKQCSFPCCLPQPSEGFGKSGVISGTLFNLKLPLYWWNNVVCQLLNALITRHLWNLHRPFQKFCDRLQINMTFF